MLKSLGEISSHAARSFGETTALVVDQRRLTFLDVDRLASQLANGLRANGVRSGDRVTLYSGNCWEWSPSRSMSRHTSLGSRLRPLVATQEAPIGTVTDTVYPRRCCLVTTPGFRAPIAHVRHRLTGIRFSSRHMGVGSEIEPVVFNPARGCRGNRRPLRCRRCRLRCPGAGPAAPSSPGRRRTPSARVATSRRSS